MTRTVSGSGPQGLIAAGSGLADLLVAENAALAAMDLAGAVALLPAKREAFAAITGAAAPQMPVLRPHVIALGDRLRELVEENQRLLERAMRVQREVLGIIARAVPTAATASCYGTTNASVRPAKVSPLTLLAQA